MNKYGQKVVWFSGVWFSSVAFIIKSMKETFGNNICIMCSAPTDEITYKNIGDAFLVEESTYSNASEYIDWTLDFCEQYKVDVFFPRFYLTQISSRIQDYEMIGTKVICEGANITNLSKSKKAMYDFIGRYIPGLIPEYYIVNDYISFSTKVKHFIDGKQGKAVMKYDNDEGANSFRVIDDSAFGWENLRKTHENVLSYNDANLIVADACKNNKLKPLMVMEYMDGPEISVDCYNSILYGFITIPRIKKRSRIKEIIADGELYEAVRNYCEQINDLLQCKNIFNIQFRWVNGELKLLEINTRISGGIHLSYPIGVMLTEIMIAETTGMRVPEFSMKDALVSQYETPVIVKEGKS